MKKQTALKTLLGIGIAGALFSGYLSFSEVFNQVCALGTCGTTVFTIPSCVYGFVMYLAVIVITTLGLKSRK